MTNVAINDRPSYIVSYRVVSFRIVSYRAVPPYYYAPCYSIRLGGETRSRNENESGTRSPRRELKSLLKTRIGDEERRGTKRVCAARLPGLHWATAPPPTRTARPTNPQPRQRRSALAAPQASITTTEPGPVHSTEKENASIPPYWALPFQPFSSPERPRDRALIT